MARIVYGVSGEGSGHASRARVILEHLESSGHEVRVVSYDRGYRDLRERFSVFETAGLTIATVENKVSVGRTVVESLCRLIPGHRRVREMKRELFDEFAPDCVITDFEPTTAYLAMHFDLPLITLDNQHRLRYMEFPCPSRLRGSAALTRAVIRALVPRPDVSLVTTFHFGRVLNGRTLLFPPVLRREVTEAQAEEGKHVLVYLTKGHDRFLEELGGFPREEFRVYGAGRTGRDGNRVFRAPSQTGFLEDLRTAKAVMATAGFTLMAETLHLRKPLLALPMKGQFEQELNALLLENLGVGMNCPAPDAASIAEFLCRLPEFGAALADYRTERSADICAKLDELLADGCAAAIDHHRRRAA